MELLQFSAPLYVAWEITHRCNACCVHCYSASGPTVSTREQLSTEEAFRVIDELASAGVMVLAFSGGEPLLRRDWRQLVRRAKTQNLVVNVGTNGSLITADMTDVLKEACVDSITVSIDSHVAEVHESIRGFKGLFARALTAVQLLRRRELRVVVGFTPMRLNWQHGRQVVELAQELGASAVNLSEYVPAGRGGLDLAISPDQLHAVLAEWIELREQMRGRMELIWHDCRVAILASEEDRRDYLGCGAGRLVARILPDGTVTPCVFLPTPIGSLREHDFAFLWRNSPLLRDFRERQGHISGNCGNCVHLQSCGGCRAVAFAYSRGDAMAGDPHCWIIRHMPTSGPRYTAGEGLPI